MGSRYLERLHDFYAEVERASKAATNPRHRAILDNFFRHVTLEGTEHWPAIFGMDPPMLAPAPVYRSNVYGRFGVDDGIDAIFKHYQNGTASLPVILDEHVFWVNDWGIASHSTIVRLMTGAEAIALGMDADDPAGHYAQTYPLGMFWPYDENALLIGENVYQLEPAELTKIEPSDVFAPEDRGVVAMEFLRTWYDPVTSQAIPA